MTLELVQDVVLATFALVVMVTDLRWRRIPNLVTYPAMAIGLALAALQRFPGELRSPFGGSPPGSGGFADHAVALVAALVLLYPLFSARAMKAGDVKLLMTVGALKGLLFLFWSFVYGAVIGGVVALGYIGVQRVARGRGMRDVLQTFIPYGVSLAAGSLLGLAVGIGR
jgi:prepilin peptidase CpaA